MQRLCGRNERCRLPGAGVARSDGPGPEGETLQRLPGKVQQGRIHRLLLCQPGVEKLLHGPGCLAKFFESNHARTALERMERPPQGGLLAQMAWLGAQRIQCCLAVGFDLADFLQENFQQFVVHGWRGHRCGCGHWRCCSGAALHGFCRDIGSDIGSDSACGRSRHGVCSTLGQKAVWLCCRHCALTGSHWRRCASGRRQGRRLRQCLRFRNLGGRRWRHCSNRGLLRWLGGRPLDSGRQRQVFHTGGGLPGGQGRVLQRFASCAGAVASHQGPQLSQCFVVHEQLARQRALVAQHVHQKTQRPQAVAQPFKGLLAFDRFADLAAQQALHGLAHARHRQRRLVQPQHRHHAPHLPQEGGNRSQGRRVLGVAEKLVHGALGFAQRGAQFAHHTAHGLAVTEVAVQLFHPRFQRLRLTPCTHLVQAFGQPLGALRQLLWRCVQFFQGCLQVQNRCGHFHRQAGRWGFVGTHRQVHGARQCLRQAFAAALELAQRIAHQAELVGRRFELAAVSTRQGGPGFSGRCNALACLRQCSRIKPAKAPRFVIDRRKALQTESLAHGIECRRLARWTAFGLRTEKQQVLHQAFREGRLSLGQAGVLHQDARSHPLHIDIGLEQAQPEGFKKTGANLPESAQPRGLLGGCQPQAGVTQLQRSLPVCRLDNFQHRAVNAGAHCRPVTQCGHAAQVQRGLAQPALHGPQVCRVHARDAIEGLHVAVLGKQGHSRHVFAGQCVVQVFTQGKAGALQHPGRTVGACLGALHKFLHRRFHGPQHQGGRRHAHHFQRAGGLVQLLARQPQGRNVQRSQVRAACHVGLGDEAAQRLDSPVQRLAQFVQHPGQRAQVLLALEFSEIWRLHSIGGLHGWVPDGLQPVVGRCVRQS